MSRIVAGAARGRRLAAPPGEDTRPTADRTREALFASIGTFVDLAGARFLDLYAGSGAVGLEALSRGAALATLVEADRRAAAVAAANAAVVGLPGADIRTVRAERLASARAEAPYDVVFADPPYALPADDLRAVLTDLLAHGWLAPAALVVLERASRDAPWQWPAGIDAVRSRRYGEGTLWYGRRP